MIIGKPYFSKKIDPLEFGRNRSKTCNTERPSVSAYPPDFLSFLRPCHNHFGQFFELNQSVNFQQIFKIKLVCLFCAPHLSGYQVMNEEPLWILCALDWGQNRKYYYPLGPEGILQNCIFSSDLWWFYTKKSSRIICSRLLGDHKIYQLLYLQTLGLLGANLVCIR